MDAQTSDHASLDHLFGGVTLGWLLSLPLADVRQIEASIVFIWEWLLLNLSPPTAATSDRLGALICRLFVSLWVHFLLSQIKETPCKSEPAVGQKLPEGGAKSAGSYSGTCSKPP